MKKATLILFFTLIFTIILTDNENIEIIMNKKETAIQSETIESSDTKNDKITKFFLNIFKL